MNGTQDILSLSHLLSGVQETLNDNFPHNYKVTAEIASMSGAKHLYLELVEKQDGQIKAKCRATIWAQQRFRIMGHFERMTQETLKAGMKILAEVRIDFHSQYGFSLHIIDIDPSYSLGELQRIKQETIQQLQADGLLEINKHLSIPKVIQNIAVISSETAAGFQDFTNQLAHNSYGYQYNIQLFKALVQGENAPESIINALDSFEKSADKFDVLVIIRGGGSVLDLSCFDDYQLNYILAQSSLPIITGIGHERDESIADLVAHTRLKTPTAVADYLINHNLFFEQDIENKLLSISKLAIDNINNKKQALLNIQQTFSYTANEQMQTARYHLKDKIYQVKSLKTRQITKGKNQLNNKVRSLRSELKFGLTKAKTLVEQKNQLLNISNPLKLLEKGYSLSFINGKTIHNSLAKKGDKLTTLTNKQKIISTIDEVNEQAKL